jgi:hypothetical protein
MLLRIARSFHSTLWVLGLSLGISQPAWSAAPDTTASSTQDAASAPLKVDVTGKAPDRDQRDYRNALKGIETFNKFHSLAPQAELHFKLYPRSETLQRDDVKLRLKSDSVHRDIELGPNWTFDIPFDATADKEQGDLVTNRPEKSFAWRSDVRTPGLPENTRRLGDLRLECMIDIDGRLPALPPVPANRTMIPIFGGKLCSLSATHYFYFADRPLFGVTLVSKEKQMSLQTAVWLYGNRTLVARSLVDFMLLDDQVYEVPLADTTWPDDTLVEFEYMDDVQPNLQHASAMIAPSTIH